MLDKTTGSVILAGDCSYFTVCSWYEFRMSLLIARADELQDLLVTRAVGCLWYELDDL